MRSWRRWSCTLICDHAESTRLRSRTTPLKARTKMRIATTTTTTMMIAVNGRPPKGLGAHCTEGPSGNRSRSGRHERTGVELEVPLRQSPHRELLGAFTAGRDEARAQRGIVEQPLQRVAQRAGVAGRNEERIAAGTGDVAVALDRRRDDRRTGRHRFEEHD